MGKMQTPVHGNEGAPLDTGTARLHACEHDNSATAPVLLQKSPADLDYFSAEQGCPETPEMAPLRGKSPAPAGAAISGETKSVARALTPEISSLGLASKWRNASVRNTSSWTWKRAAPRLRGPGAIFVVPHRPDQPFRQGTVVSHEGFSFHFRALMSPVALAGNCAVTGEDAGDL